VIFEQELEAGESAEALEGLSWAAWWLDDADMVFEARERAYRLYSRGRDPASAARMATWLAADHLDFHGALAVANGWLRRAGRMLEPLEPGADHGWLAFHEGHITGMCGDTVKAEELGVRAAQLGRRFEVPDLEMLGLALQGGQPRRIRSGRGGHALPRRGHGGGPGRRRYGPDLECLDLLFPGLGLHRRARLRASLRVVRPDRGVRRALREPLHARLLSRRVRRGPPLAGPVGGCGDAPGSLDRRLFTLAASVGGGSAGDAGRAATAAGEAMRLAKLRGPKRLAPVERQPGAAELRRRRSARLVQHHPSDDTIVIELVEPADMPAVVRIVWPSAPTITTAAKFNEVAAEAMKILAYASTR
jgi:hypothetical protein